MPVAVVVAVIPFVVVAIFLDFAVPYVVVAVSFVVVVAAAHN